VQLQEDGNYKFGGRKDRQVKIRGYRVELDGVEAAIISHSKVEEAAVFAVRDEEGRNQIEAAVIPKVNGEAPLETKELLTSLRDSVPWYALPQAIVIRQDFPRTSSGKINRRELKECAQDKEVA